MKVIVAQFCTTLWDFMNHSSPGTSVHETLQARILEWVAIPFFRESSQPRDWTQVSCIAGRFFTVWVTREAHDVLIVSSPLSKNLPAIFGEIKRIADNIKLLSGHAFVCVPRGQYLHCQKKTVNYNLAWTRRTGAQSSGTCNIHWRLCLNIFTIQVKRNGSR